VSAHYADGKPFVQNLKIDVGLATGCVSRLAARRRWLEDVVPSRDTSLDAVRERTFCSGSAASARPPTRGKGNYHRDGLRASKPASCGASRGRTAGMAASRRLRSE
jgi:hypothetical protein